VLVLCGIDGQPVSTSRPTVAKDDARLGAATIQVNSPPSNGREGGPAGLVHVLKMP
jgi:hypothetical protein